MMNTAINSFFCLLAIVYPSLSVSNLPVCYRLNGEWTRGNDGHQYKLVMKKKNFSDAKAFCDSIGGNLAMEKNQDISNFINGWLNEPHFSLWIGVHRTPNVANGSYVFIDGSSISSSSNGRWSANASKTNGCVAHGSDGSANETQWIDSPCEDEKEFLCQKKISTMNSQCFRERAYALMYSGHSWVSLRAVSCDKDGSYSAKQCEGDNCWCALPTGEKIDHSTHASNSTVDCAALRENYKWKLHMEKKSWKDAGKTCRAEGGELIKVDTPFVQNWLAKQDMKLGELWIGASDEGHEGKFTWADGQEATNEYWGTVGKIKQPDNFKDNQNCACVNWVHPGYWDDQNCQTKKAFVCQYPKKGCEVAKMNDQFKPNCDPNGDFSAVQCYSNFCWCSMPDGTVIPKFYEQSELKPHTCWSHRVLTHDCGGDYGIVRHPLTPTFYLHCAPSGVYACKCPAELMYDPTHGVCVFSSTYFADEKNTNFYDLLRFP